MTRALHADAVQHARLAWLCCLVAALLLLGGCGGQRSSSDNGSDVQSAGQRTQPALPGLGEAQRTLAVDAFRQESCGACHVLDGGGLDTVGQIGPPLSAEGDRNRTDDWLRTVILDPGAIPAEERAPGYRSGRSNMPSYRGRLTEEQIAALIAFLQHLHASP